MQFGSWFFTVLGKISSFVSLAPLNTGCPTKPAYSISLKSARNLQIISMVTAKSLFFTVSIVCVLNKHDDSEVYSTSVFRQKSNEPNLNFSIALFLLEPVGLIRSQAHILTIEYFYCTQRLRIARSNRPTRRGASLPEDRSRAGFRSVVFV